jgi:excisionase family DNA binding protein
MTGRSLLTIAEVADRTGFSAVTLYRWARTGQIPSKKFGRSVRFESRAVDAWIAKNNTKKR